MHLCMYVHQLFRSLPINCPGNEELVRKMSIILSQIFQSAGVHLRCFVVMCVYLDATSYEIILIYITGKIF